MTLPGIRTWYFKVHFCHHHHWALSSNTSWADFIGLTGIRFKNSFVLSRPCFLTLNLFFFFFPLLIRVKFSTEKDAVLFALKVSLFLWKLLLIFVSHFIIQQEKWWYKVLYILCLSVWLGITPLSSRNFKSIVTLSQRHRIEIFPLEFVANRNLEVERSDEVLRRTR